jgi:hypothetical protein
MTDAVSESLAPGGGPEPITDTAAPKLRLRINKDLLWKVLAVLGVVLLAYVLIYLGTWLAMQN